MKHLDKVLLDADICFKLGRFLNSVHIEKIIPLIANSIYIHEYVYEKELQTSDTGKLQLVNLVNVNTVTVLKEEQLVGTEKLAYEDTIKLLCKVMKGSDTFYDNEHRGEIVSLAMAKTLGIPIFMTNEKDLQPIINSKLNTGVTEPIHVFRLIDLMYWIKEHPECGIDRKEARKIWCGAYDKRKLEHYKNIFNNQIWES